MRKESLRLAHNALVHKQDLVKTLLGKAHFVGDDDHGHIAIGKALDDGQYLVGQLRI